MSGLNIDNDKVISCEAFDLLTKVNIKLSFDTAHIIKGTLLKGIEQERVNHRAETLQQKQ